MTMMDGSNGKSRYLVLAKINAVKGYVQSVLYRIWI
jgi:hypothetical protein